MMQEKSQTVALYGGSFDPPHIGHEAVVKAILSSNLVDKIILMPAFLNPFKKSSFAPPKQRLAWLKEIFSSYEKVLISSYEIEQNRSVATLESVEHLLKSYTKIYLVIGADNLASLKEWYKSELLLSKVEVLVASRDGIEVPSEYKTISVDTPVSSTDLRKNLVKKLLPEVVADAIVKYYKEKNER